MIDTYYSYNMDFSKRVLRSSSVLFTGIFYLFLTVNAFIVAFYDVFDFLHINLGFRYFYIAVGIYTLYMGICYIALYKNSKADDERSVIMKPLVFLQVGHILLLLAAIFTSILFIWNWIYGTLPRTFLIGLYAVLLFLGVYSVVSFVFTKQLLSNLYKHKMSVDMLRFYVFICVCAIILLFGMLFYSIVLFAHMDIMLPILIPIILTLLIVILNILIAVSYRMSVRSLIEDGVDITYSVRQKALICPCCERQVSYNEAFCPHCGTKLAR